MNSNKNYQLAPVNTLKKYVGVHFTDKAIDSKGWTLTDQRVVCGRKVMVATRH